MVVSLIVALALAIIVCIFALQNSALVSVTFLTWKFTHSLALILLGTFAVGVLAGILVMLPAFIKKHMQLSAHRKQLLRRAEPEESEEEAEHFL